MAESFSLLKQCDITKEQVERLAFVPQKGGSFLLLPGFQCWWSPEIIDYLHFPETNNQDFSTYFLLIYPEDLPAFREALRQLWGTGTCRFSHRIWLNGDVVSVDFSASRYPHPQKGWFAVGAVAEREQVSHPCSIETEVSFPNGTFLSPSPALAEFLHVPESQLSSISLPHLIAEEERPIFQHWFSALPTALLSSNGTFQAKGGGKLYLTASLEAQSQPVHITFWKNPREENVPYSGFEKAKLKQELCTQMFSGFAAELQSPIQVMISALQLCETQLSAIFPKEQKELLRKYFFYIHQNLNHLTQITENLLEAAQLNNGVFATQFQFCEILDLAQSILESARPYAIQCGVELRFENNTGMERLLLCCDSLCIEHILLNLLSNALKNTRPGGMISLHVSQEEAFVRLAVKDNGVGMSPDRLAQVLGHYRDLLSTGHSLPETDWGFGLRIVRSLAALHQGNLEGISKAGEGSCFSVTLSRALQPDTNTVVRQNTLEQRPQEREHRAAIAFSKALLSRFPIHEGISFLEKA